MIANLASSWLRVTAVIASIGCLATAAHASTRPGPRLDQEETAGLYYGGGASGPTDFDAQTFTAGITGTLESVQLRIGWTHDPGPLGVQLRSVVHGVPSDFVLSSTTLYPTKITATSPHWVTVPLTAASRAGAHYAIVVNDLSSSGCNPCWSWPFTSRRAQEDAYPGGGDYYYYYSQGDPRWLPLGNGQQTVDHPFKTFVTPVPPQGGVSLPYEPLSAGLAPDGTLDPSPSDHQPAVAGNARAGVLVFNSKWDWRRVRLRLANAVGERLLDGFPFTAYSAAIAYVEVPYTPPPASTFGSGPSTLPDVSSFIWIKRISTGAKGYLNVALGAVDGACLPNTVSCLTPETFAQAWVAVVLPPRLLRPLRHVHFTVATP